MIVNGNEWTVVNIKIKLTSDNHYKNNFLFWLQVYRYVKIMYFKINRQTFTRKVIDLNFTLEDIWSWAILTSTAYLIYFVNNLIYLFCVTHNCHISKLLSLFWWNTSGIFKNLKSNELWEIIISALCYTVLRLYCQMALIPVNVVERHIAL